MAPATTTTALILALLPFVLSQSQSAASTTGSITQALAAPSASLSIDPNLPQTALTTVAGFTIPALTALTSNAVPDGTVALPTTYTAGAQPTKVSGAPSLPNPANISPANYPALDKLPPTDSAEVQGWLSRIDFSKVPNYGVTDGTCGGTPGALTDGRCWWTCGGCTRSTDITQCPDKNTWGLSYDDGPSPYTPILLDYLDANALTTTFFLVGSRVISRPQIVQTEYMAGHQLSVHTWSHPYLTKLTNEQIVAELGWTKKVIKDVTGVTPNTFRPPYGDIDDRVRAIAAQMGLTPIIWTSVVINGTRSTFDTTDWNIPAGTANGPSALSRFNTILNTYAPALTAGFIVLEHDLYQQAVDLAVGWILPQAQKQYKLKSIISCLNQPLSEAYIETSSNASTTRITSGASTYFQPTLNSQTFGSASQTSGGAASSGGSGSGSAASSGSGGGANAAVSSGGAAAASSSRAAGERVLAGLGQKGVWGVVVGVLGVGLGMVFVA